MTTLQAFLDTLRGLRDWRVWLLAAVSIGGLWWITGSDLRALVLAHLSVGLAAALALVYRKWLFPDLSRYRDRALDEPLSAALVVLGASIVVAAVILAVGRVV